MQGVLLRSLRRVAFNIYSTSFRFRMKFRATFRSICHLALNGYGLVCAVRIQLASEFNQHIQPETEKIHKSYTSTACRKYYSTLRYSIGDKHDRGLRARLRLLSRRLA
jgi:hypothetical protein